MAPARMHELQRDLLRHGQFIPEVALDDPEDLTQTARIGATSELKLASLPPDGPHLRLEQSWAQMLPVQPGPMPRLTIPVTVAAPTTLHVELRTSDRPTNYTPDLLLAQKEIVFSQAEETTIDLNFEVTIDAARYVFVCFRQNQDVHLWTSQQRITGLLSAANKWNRAVSNYGAQAAPEGIDIGIEAFEFWTPERRPQGLNIALNCEPPLAVFGASNIANGTARPTSGPNAWVAAVDDPLPAVTLQWDTPQSIRTIDLSFDTDFDHPMESVLMTHPERAMPFCVKTFRICIDGREVAAVDDNHQTRRRITLDEPIVAQHLAVEVLEMQGAAPAALFEVRCYG